MKIWQGFMIGLARSEAITRFVQEWAPGSGLARRFVAGPQIDDAVKTARDLRTRRLSTSTFFLGEYVTDAQKVETNVSGILRAISAIDGSEVDLHVSVDPSQIGYAVSDTLGETNARRIAKAMAEKSSVGRKTMMLDMEDVDYVQKTIDLHDRLKAEGFPVAITLQAYLRRTEADLGALSAHGATIRLVKGAFLGSTDIAFASRREIDENFMRLAEILLCEESKTAGARPVFGTHDHRMIAALREMARKSGWHRDQYEFEMLLGVRPDLQTRLAAQGEGLRVYMPFGRDWWPYAVRRVGESPRNAWFLTRALLTRG